jgi:hypothetical protein
MVGTSHNVYYVKYRRWLPESAIRAFVPAFARRLRYAAGALDA